MACEKNPECKCTVYGGGDELHTVRGGVAKYFAGAGFVLLLLADVYQTKATSRDLLLKESMKPLTARLHAWYRAHPDASRVALLTVSLCTNGSVYKPQLAGTLKADESKWLAHFVCDEIGYFIKKNKLVSQRARDLHRAGLCLLQWWELLYTAGREFTSEEAAAALSAAVNHMTLFEKAGEHLYPKHHRFLHMATNVNRHGSPAYHSTFPDESFNFTAVKMARAAHPSLLALTTLKRYYVWCKTSCRHW